MNVLGISSSLKVDSISRQALTMFGNRFEQQEEYTQINFNDTSNMDLYCNVCGMCNKESHCVRKLNNHLLERVKQADILVLAFPIYYGGISGKSKSILELMYPLKNGELKNKKIVVILSSEKENQEGIAVIELLAWCFKHGCKLIRVDTISSETTIESKMKMTIDIQHLINEDNDMEMIISFDDFKYFDKIVGIPIEYKTKIK